MLNKLSKQVSDDLEVLTALTPYQFVQGRKNTSAPFMPSSEHYQDLKNIIQIGSIVCSHDPENMDSRKPSTTETRNRSSQKNGT